MNKTEAIQKFIAETMPYITVENSLTVIEDKLKHKAGKLYDDGFMEGQLNVIKKTHGGKYGLV